MMELVLTPVVDFGEIHSPHLHDGTSGMSVSEFSDLLWSAEMLKRGWGVENNRKLLHLFIPSKTATVVPEFAVEDLPLDKTATLVPAFAVKTCPWAEQSDDDHYDYYYHSQLVESQDITWKGNCIQI